MSLRVHARDVVNHESWFTTYHLWPITTWFLKRHNSDDGVKMHLRLTFFSIFVWLKAVKYWLTISGNPDDWISFSDWLPSGNPELKINLKTIIDEWTSLPLWEHLWKYLIGQKMTSLKLQKKSCLETFKDQMQKPSRI